MSELNKFLKQQESQGEAEKGQGAFTVAPHLARRKLADSVPESLSSPWAALGFLRAAFEMSGLEPAVESSGGIIHDVPLTLTRSSPVLMGLNFKATSNWELEPFLDTLRKSCEQPFSESSPVGLCLSRAVLILSKNDIDASFRFCGFPVDDYYLNQGEELRVDRPMHTKIVMKEPLCIAVLFSDHEEWHWARSSGEHDGFENQRRRLKAITEKNSPLSEIKKLQEQAQSKELSLFGISVQKHSVWTRSPARPVLESLFDYWNTGNWFDYRAKRVILAEVMVPTTEESPLKVSRECLSASGLHRRQKPGEMMTSWERFRTEGERLVIRHWTDTPSQDDEFIPVKAVFAVALTDAGSRVTFTNWGHTPEVTSLPELPGGLAAFVHWPGLKQSLYGDAWVRDDAYEEAMAWVVDEAKNVFRLLAEEFEYVWSMMLRDHVRKSYRAEVKSRMESWLVPTSS